MYTHDTETLNAGWTPNPEAVRAIAASLPFNGQLASAAPHWLGDGMTGDLMPYLAWYDVEIKNPDGSVWKAKGDEPPYKPQTGNNCTSEGLMHVADLEQCLLADDGQTVPIRTCVEATYAFGLYKAGMRGDSGCYGGAMAKGASEIGLVPYRDVQAPHDESGSRLRQWANDPSGIVDQLKDKAAPYRAQTIAQVTTWEELCGAIANKRLVTIASNYGFATPRNDQGICEARGTWNHQMCVVGIIRSDGVETAVICQSWGPNQPNGPRPFKLPSFCFRARKDAVLGILGQNDSWVVSSIPGYEKAPLPDKWTLGGFA